jgi:hypothetical protein
MEGYDKLVEIHGKDFVDLVLSEYRIQKIERLETRIKNIQKENEKLQSKVLELNKMLDRTMQCIADECVPTNSELSKFCKNDERHSFEMDCIACQTQYIMEGK